MNTPKFDVLQFSPDPTRQSMPLAERVRQLEAELSEATDQCDKMRAANGWLLQRVDEAGSLLTEAGAGALILPEWAARHQGWCRLMCGGVPT